MAVREQIILEGIDKTQRAFGDVNKRLKGIESNTSRAGSAFSKLQTIVVGAAAAIGAIKLSKDFLNTAVEVENLGIQLKFLTGSAEEGAKAMDILTKFAGTVPFELQQIANAAPNLLTVVDSTDELNEMLQITGDIAAATGLSFKETAEQLQRSFSGGIAAADMFREKGVKALLGFEEGVRYNAEQTKELIIKSFRDGTMVMKGASKDMATTFTGTATTASSLTGTPNITVGIVTATKLIANSIDVPSTGITTVSKLLHVGTGGTAFSALEAGRIGVGTALPTSELQIRKSSGSLAEVVSDSGQARISVGNSVGVGNSSAVLRFGNSAGVLDIINNDVGDIKTIIHGGAGAGSTGNFKWVYGQTNAERMTLTYDGKLGINQSSPTNTLHVVGTSTVTGNAFVGGNLNVAGNVTGNITLDPILTDTNLNNTSGITTLSQLEVTESVDFSSATLVGLGNTVAIGTDAGSTDYGLVVNNGIRASEIEVNVGGINANTGIITALDFVASGGFRVSTGSTNAVQIEYASSPNRVIFTVVGIGSTSFNLV